MCQARNGKQRERERNGKGTRSFLSRSSIFGNPVFPVSGQNHEKRVKNEAERPKDGRKDVEQQKNGRSTLFQIVEFGEIPFFCRLKPVSNPVPTHFLPRFFPVLAPFLYYSAITSRCVPVAAQPLDHVGPSLVRGTSGRFVFVARRC